MTESVYEQLARMAGALANPTRLHALNLLFQGPKAIESLAASLGESEANTAAHMKALRAAGLVTAKRQGKYVFQQATDESVLRLFLALREAGEWLNPTIRLLNEAQDENASSVTPSELEHLLQSKNAVLVDLRPEQEFELGHIPGARSLPFATLHERLTELPTRRRVFAYCRGKYCPKAQLGATVLQEAGLRAKWLRFGVPEWRASGHAVESGARA